MTIVNFPKLFIKKVPLNLDVQFGRIDSLTKIRALAEASKHLVLHLLISDLTPQIAVMVI